MTPLQLELLDLIDLLLSQVCEDKTYRHIRVLIGGREILLEDTRRTVLLADCVSSSDYGQYVSSSDYGLPIFDVDRSWGGNYVHTWNEARALALLPLPKQRFILDMLSDL